MTVRLLRQASGLSQNKFCQAYQIPLKTLQNWESKEDSPSYRVCPPYILILLEKAVRSDYPESQKYLNSQIDELHFTAIKQAKGIINKSPLSKYVKDLYLYGSTARGTAKQSSDIDLLLVLDKNVKTKAKYNDWITYLKGNISSDDYRIPETDLHVVFDENWTNRKDAYFQNIKNEGFSIWN